MEGHFADIQQRMIECGDGPIIRCRLEDSPAE
ncbi:hypothetical protein EC912_103264 [Luteibacter rhizovicinus]|uniref:Uncharacterized protein n=1 Tax=Luteibacter rhizovicinus TaxID=242606 RepID=A0A4V6P451_9GAMM|nr:hypothetical protein EC912_103264 [Luteibacter rhizovicinus]